MTPTAIPTSAIAILAKPLNPAVALPAALELVVAGAEVLALELPPEVLEVPVPEDAGEVTELEPEAPAAAEEAAAETEEATLDAPETLKGI